METGESEQVIIRSMMAADTRGKHRISAALKTLHQETHSLQEEVEELEKMGASSSVCKEILNDVETRPDPLLPITNGPTTPLWDRWFERPQDKSDCRCRIM